MWRPIGRPRVGGLHPFDTRRLMHQAATNQRMVGPALKLLRDSPIAALRTVASVEERSGCLQLPGQSIRSGSAFGGPPGQRRRGIEDAADIVAELPADPFQFIPGQRM